MDFSKDERIIGVKDLLFTTKMSHITLVSRLLIFDQQLRDPLYDAAIA